MTKPNASRRRLIQCHFLTPTPISQSEHHQQQQQLQQQHVRPAISMPKSKSYGDEDDGGGSAHPGQKPSLGGSSDSAGKQQASGKQSSSGGDLGAPGNQNAGWFGGLWNKLSLKPKNQMILPDDKNPTIVWDKERKCWTNTEGTAEEAESFKPPPKMSDLGMGMPPGVPAAAPAGPPVGLGMGMGLGMGTALPPMATNPLGGSQQPAPLMDQQQPPAQPQMYGSPIDYTAAPAPEMIPTVPSPAPLPVPSPAPVTAATPNPAANPGGPQPKLQSNIFKMQRNRTLKNSYVDVFNPSGAPMSAASENVLAPIMAPAAVPQGGYFVPGAAPTHQQ